MFISYAQNFEDVILWRALKHVERGFYVDIGAQDPVIDSVSLAFYKNGWRGIHVEPNPEFATSLRNSRPDEEVLEIAIGKEDGEIEFFDIPGTGLSTGDKEISRTHEARGLQVRQLSVPCRPLWTVLDAYVGRDIHWLKIDVEGMEQQVIESWSPSTVRPWIVVVESTEPNSTRQNHMPWDFKLLELGYEFSYFDGLNRFYVNVEHSELRNSFGPGPNIFDNFALSGTASGPICENLNAKVDALRRQLSEEQGAKAALETQLVDVQSARAALEAQLVDVQSARTALEAQLVEERGATAARDARLAEVYASISWRVTKPLRFANHEAHWRWARIRNKFWP
ncbi:Methyltransferase FkbM family protein [Mesorhizobium sp. ORS 3324]|nr:Methyltransferase FkbM family protein [Mesorhizobium sp. ORS 3324]